VVNLRFADTPAVPELQEAGLLASLLQPTKEDVLRAGMAALAVPPSTAITRPLASVSTVTWPMASAGVSAVVDVVKSNPTETVEVLRTWINDR
jgi:flagellar M-ring protein FliF